MKRLSLVLLLALFLPGCAALQNAYNVLTGVTISPTSVYVAANAFDTAEGTATTYLALPACTGSNGPVCRNAQIAAQVVKLIRQGRPIRNQLEALISAGQGNAPVPATLYATFTALLASIQQAIAQSGVSQ
jgi:hypothetical protein